MFANWKTTLAGVVAAVGMAVSAFLTEGGTDWKKLVVAVGIAAMGALAKDHNVDAPK